VKIPRTSNGKEGENPISSNKGQVEFRGKNSKIIFFIGGKKNYTILNYNIFDKIKDFLSLIGFPAMIFPGSQ